MWGSEPGSWAWVASVISQEPYRGSVSTPTIGDATDLFFHSGYPLPCAQDEMELGYVQAPHKTFPVVFDSPRNGHLQHFPYKRILVSVQVAWECPLHHPRARSRVARKMQELPSEI